MSDARQNPEEPLVADGFDDAIIGVARRCGQPDLVAYSVAKALEILMLDGATYADAVDYFEFNVVGAWHGEGTPIWVYEGGIDEWEWGGH